MRNKEDLFTLVKAMSRSEKRYFVLDAKKSGGSTNRYLTLFGTLSKMEEFDEEKLKKKFPKNLPTDKAYLYEAILRSMRDYRSTASKAAQVKERLMDARFLYERGLYGQSHARIQQAKSLATELEDNFSLLEIIKEEQLSLFDRRIKVTADQVQSLQEEKEIIEQNIEEELNYIGLYCSLAVEFFKQGVIKGKKELGLLEKRLPIQFLNDENKPNSKLALRRYYLCNAIFFRIKGDIKKTKEYYEKAALWWEGNPAVKEEEFYRYVGDVNNLINTCYTNLELFGVAQFWFDKLKKEQSGRNYHEKKYVFLSLSISNLLHHLNNANKTSSKTALIDIIKGIEKYKLNKSILLLINIVTAFFWLKDYESCIKWGGVLTSLKKNSRRDIQAIAMIYQMVSYFEMDMIDEMDAGFRSVNRFFKKTGVLKESFEYMVLNKFLKNIFNAPLNELNIKLNEFYDYLNNIENDPEKEKPIGLGELLLWVKDSL